MSNDSYITSKRNGNWSVPSNLPTSPWHGSGWDRQGITPSSPAAGNTDEDLGFFVNIDHDIVVDVDGTVGAWFPPASFEPVNFSATAGSVATRLPTGNYRACYATGTSGGGRGLSSTGFTESAQVFLTKGVSKPRITFPAAPPDGFVRHVYLTNTDGAPGTERIYAISVTTGHIDLKTELYLTDKAGSSDPVVESDQYSKPYGRDVFDPAEHRLCNAITIGPEGSLRLKAGVTLTVAGDIWIEGKPDGGHEYIIFEAGSRIVWDYSQCINPADTEYTIWPAGGGRIRFEGPS